MTKTYVVTAFFKSNDELAFESGLFTISLKRLRQIFKCSPDDQMIGMIPVRPDQGIELVRFVNIEFNFDEFEYFVQERLE